MRPRTFVVGRDPRRTLLRASALVVAAYITFGWILLPLRLSGISMEPTYHDGRFAFANRIAYVFRNPARGDVVALRMAGLHVVYVKRIVGLPGEQLEIIDGVVRINGAPLEEPTVVRRSPWNLGPVTLGADEFFVIGDNRAMTIENHALGRAPRARLVGPLLF